MYVGLAFIHLKIKINIENGSTQMSPLLRTENVTDRKCYGQKMLRTENVTDRKCNSSAFKTRFIFSSRSQHTRDYNLFIFSRSTAIMWNRHILSFFMNRNPDSKSIYIGNDLISIAIWCQLARVNYFKDKKIARARRANCGRWKFYKKENIWYSLVYQCLFNTFKPNFMRNLVVTFK